MGSSSLGSLTSASDLAFPLSPAFPYPALAPTSSLAFWNLETRDFDCRIEKINLQRTNNSGRSPGTVNEKPQDSGGRA